MGPSEADRILRPVERGDIAQLSRSLGLTFHDYPIQRWMFPDEQIRTIRCPRSIAVYIRLRLPYKTVFTTAELEGAAIWDPPGRVNPTITENLWLAAKMLPLLRGRARLVSRGFALLGQHRPTDPHWYLATLGVDPQHQGRGVGGALLRPILRECDARGLVAHLETSDPANNIPYYERFGFEVVGEVQMPEGPTVAVMTRRPASEGAV
jgi:ribosomal protein S18 acetylase RimI-like enzyme